MPADAKINLCYPCGFFRPGDAENPIAGEYQSIHGAVWPKTAHLFWNKLEMLEPEKVCACSGGIPGENGTIQLASLHEHWGIDPEGKKITKLNPDNTTACNEWDRQIPFLVLVYLVTARNGPVSYDMVLPRDLFKGFDLFRNSLDMDMQGIKRAFGHDGEGFLNAARRLGAEPIRGGDMAVRFRVFPKVPVDYILWLGDTEFPPNLTILVDRSAPRHLTADAIAVAVNLLSRRMCEEAEVKPFAG